MKKGYQRVAVAGGLMWGGLMAVCTVAALLFTGYSSSFLTVMASIYPGYTISVSGIVVGAVYGFFDVFLGTYIFWWIYKALGK
jgi:hypothetical protein